ncbi:hypothetical protein HDU96_010736 [Phlyctochytrium bullatum]|nr:hypothetical protein HDU96_010736 [Phlyctochytrium bullatum]
MTSEPLPPCPDYVGQRIDTAEGQRGTVLYQGPLPPPWASSATAASSASSSSLVWLGIEWDDPSRGKHSGDYKGTQVFCSKVPNSSSFVRLDALKLRFPRGFVRALAERYLSSDYDVQQLLQSLVSVDKKDGEPVPASVTAVASVDGSLEKSGTLRLGDATVVVETVGWEKVSRKQSQLWRLREISLAAMEVGFVPEGFHGWEPEGLIRAVCPSVVDADLSRNLFSRWRDVAAVCRELASLETVRLNHSRIWWWTERPPPVPEGEQETGPRTRFPPFFDPYAALPPNSFSKVKVLALNYTGIPWAEIERVVAPHFPALEELHLGFNGISHLRVIHSWHDLAQGADASNDHFYASSSTAAAGDGTASPAALLPNLKLLNLESNLLSDWTEIARLAARLPSLNNLHLPNNRIPFIPCPPHNVPGPTDDDDDATIPADAPPAPPVLPTLRTLNLSQNQIADWASLHALNHLAPALKELRFKGNPVTLTLEREATRTDLLFELVARVASVAAVNGSAIPAKDRKDAEWWYLGRSAVERKQMLAAPQQQDGTTTAAQRLAAFRALHPRYDELVRLHGEPDVAPAAATSTALKDRVVQLRLFAVVLVRDGGDAPGADPMLGALRPSEVAAGCRAVHLRDATKRVPFTMTVRGLRTLMVRLLVPRERAGLRVVRMERWTDLVVAGEAGARVEGDEGAAAAAQGKMAIVEFAGTRAWMDPLEMDDELKELGFFDLRLGDAVRLVLEE